MYRSYIDTSIGLIKVSADDSAITEVSYIVNADSKQAVLENRITMKAAKQLQEYFNEQRETFDVPINVSGTKFQMQVWQALCQIPYGKTVSYKEVAEMIGHPKAYRAVGTAIGKNPLMIIIPCHRVIASDKTLGGFAYGLEVKKKLLNLEHAV